MSRLLEPLITPVPGAADGKMTPRAAERYVKNLLARVKLTGLGCRVEAVGDGQVSATSSAWSPSYMNHPSADTAQLVRVPMPKASSSGPVQPWPAAQLVAPPGLATTQWAVPVIRRVAEGFGLDARGPGMSVSRVEPGTVVIHREQNHLLHPWKVSVDNGVVRVRPGGLGVYGVEGDVMPTITGVPLNGTPQPSIFVGLNYTGWIALTTYWVDADPVSVEAWEVVATASLLPKGSGGFAHVPIAFLAGGQVAVQLTRYRIGIGSSGGPRVEADWGW